MREEQHQFYELVKERKEEAKRESAAILSEQFRVRDAGNFFSRLNCEWVEYFETCDYQEDCSGSIKSQKTNWAFEWTSCNITITNQIRQIFPDVDLKFEEPLAWGQRCIPRQWSGPEFCGPVTKESSRSFYMFF